MSETGIVTSADVGDMLVGIAGPYIDLSECEMQLRRLVKSCLSHSRITEEEVADAVAKHRRSYSGNVDDLPLGSLISIICLNGVREAIGVDYDPDTLLDQLKSIAAARNSVMHFRELNLKGQAALGVTPALAAIVRHVCSRLEAQAKV